MKINSGFKDYYDHGQVYYDDYVQFNRKTETITLKKESMLKQEHKHTFFKISISNLFHTHSKCGLKFGVIGFCGKYYPIIHYNNYLKTINLYSKKNVEDHIDVLPKDVHDLALEFFNLNMDFEENHFIKYNTPYFIFWFDRKNDPNTAHMYQYEIQLLPKLSDYEFIKQVDPHQAYQEIEMFLSNDLKSMENPMIKISDKDKINQHGFDPKYGFRKLPEKKKK